MKLLKKIFFRVFLLLGNNVFTNNILILLGKDAFIKRWVYNWSIKQIDKNKSLQENMGYSQLSAINKLVEETHIRLAGYAKDLRENSCVLDIGCGVGLHLKDFSESRKDLNLYGIDLNAEYIEIARKNIPGSHCVVGNYLDVEIEQKFSLIYSIGVFQYIEPSRLDYYFQKLTNNLESGGKYWMLYMHALSNKDTFYPDLSCVKYSPEVVAKVASKYLRIDVHQHFFDGRKVGRFDEKHYLFPGSTTRVDTVENSYFIVATKV